MALTSRVLCRWRWRRAAHRCALPFDLRSLAVLLWELLTGKAPWPPNISFGQIACRAGFPSCSLARGQGEVCKGRGDPLRGIKGTRGIPRIKQNNLNRRVHHVTEIVPWYHYHGPIIKTAFV